ncbi:MAG: cupin domain-containing protein [Burkholderiaceae bacterium]|nr:cupin domain-containing protein [Burkholderiaceae bacterium]
MTPRAQELIDQLALQPHPEGGFYAEVHRAAHPVTPDDGRGQRAALTSIYFLLPAGAVSRWHVVRSDEAWIHLEGAPIALHQIDGPSCRAWTTRLGPVGGALRPQATVAAGLWQAAQTEGEFSLAACLVAPGFEFSDFRLMDAAAGDAALAGWLRHEHPALAALI